MVHRKKLLFLLFCLSLYPGIAVLACSSKGPADPVTGMITYPPGAGHDEGSTNVPPEGLEGTPFQGGKFFKGWLEKDMKLIVVPVGTSLAFEGVIEAAGTSRPPYWEEGVVKEVGGTTVDSAAPPVWTISGNGRGDYRDGNFPPAVGLSYKNFESPPSAIIAEDTPNEKALWKLTYDRDTAVRVLVTVWNDPVVRSMFVGATDIPADFDMNAVAARAKDPQADDGAKGLSDYEVSANSAGSVADLRIALDGLLTQRTGQIAQTGGVVTRKFLRSDDTEFTVDMAADARVIIKAGYIAMQGATGMDYYPTGRYDTKYYITPPSSSEHEVSQSKLLMNFSAPTAPDYWIIDLHSGLESARDCVWCWIEADAVLKPEDTRIDDPSDVKNFYTIVEDSYAVGGVFVRGLYSSGNSSAGRNTMVYVVVADTESPAHYEWEAATVEGQTGQTLNSGGAPLKFRVFDNNPVIGADSHNNIFDVFDLEDFSFIEASQKPVGGSHNPDVFSRFLKPVKDGFDEKNLAPALHYNVCVPIFAGLKVNTDPRAYDGPLPLVNDVLMLPLQKFLWKTADSDKVTIGEKRIYDANGNVVSGLESLRDGANWNGYSSYLVTVTSDGLSEEMGYAIADNSKDQVLSISADLKASAPTKNLFSEGVPVDTQKVFYYGWNGQAIKLFASAGDGITIFNGDDSVNLDLSNRTPKFRGDISLEKLLSSKFSGAELAYPPTAVDFVALWDEPTTVDQLSAKLQADKLVKGGKLGGCSLPPGAVAPDGAWGKFLYASALADNGKPNIALEVVNSKNEKAVVYGNLYATAENENLVKAIDGAGTDNWAFSSDSNNGGTAYKAGSLYNDDAAWDFREKLDTDLYLAMAESMDNNAFKPWLFAFGASDQPKLWKTAYWNGSAAFNNERLAFQQGSRDRLVFRYWAWDNINPMLQDMSYPGGVKSDSNAARSRFKSVVGPVTAEVKLVDVPGYRGEVSLDKVWWPDYIFHNPSTSTAEECSISLKVEDEKANSRLMKLWFRIVPPSRELIRTIEDRRNKMIDQ